jgi:hypothetical protein
MTCPFSPTLTETFDEAFALHPSASHTAVLNDILFVSLGLALVMEFNSLKHDSLFPLQMNAYNYFLGPAIR